jgi:glycine/D-amino acid oxidase-like deaminating enzyme
MSTTPILPFKNNFYSDNQPPRTAALSGKNKADVVIVGAGIVGLCSAYTLREEGLDVVVLEREHVGFGTSGRHLGHVTPQMWDMGGDARLGGWAQASLDTTERMIVNEGIDCGFKRCTFWLPALNERTAFDLPLSAKIYGDLGLDVELIEADEFDLVTYKTFGAFGMHNQARLEPYKFMRGMRDVLLRKGVRLFEGTNVTNVDSGPEVVVRSNHGTIRAPKVVLAVNAYSAQFPFLKSFMMPVHTYSIATAPLTAAAARTVGPLKSQDLMIFDYGRGENDPHFYQRLRADGRFIFGGGDPVFPASTEQTAPDNNPEQFRLVHAEMVRRYPSLGQAPIEAAWGGAMTFTANGLPIIKEVPGQDNIIVALVGNGNGIGLGAAAGPLVKGLVLGRDSIDASTQRFLKFCSWPQQ